jgi:Base plate wedge protein 53
MATQYNSASPYYKTTLTGGYLDVIEFRNISSRKEDVEYQIDAKYENRPDLLAYDLYGDTRLWWVFAVRNKSKLKDPVYDLVAGMKIFVPNPNTLMADLGK